MSRARFRTGRAAIFAALALGALLAAPTFAVGALPEVKPTPTPTSPLTFEYQANTIVQFTEQSTFLRMQCNSGLLGTGSFTGAKALTVKFTFTGCYLESATEKCHSEGAKAGEVKTATVSGELVYISKASKEVGIVLNQSEGKVGGSFASFECGLFESIAPRVSGSVIIPVTPINTKTKKFVLTALERVWEGREDDGEQRVKTYENEAGESVYRELTLHLGTTYTLGGAFRSPEDVLYGFHGKATEPEVKA
ncbi:MAG TPA: hypothetical protein VGG98_09475 [Solirubrobacteraceae bacterium]|jgi:hypothetical protein